MDCPCYRAIYSATPNIPAAIAAIIADYGHSFSDSEFDELDDRDNQYISCNYNNVIDYVFPGKYEYNIIGDGFDGKWISSAIRMDSGILTFYLIDCCDDSDRQKYATVRCVGNIYEFIHNNFGPRGRVAIWEKLNRFEQMSAKFIAMCDAIVRIISDWLYSKPRTLVCPHSD